MNADKLSKLQSQVRIGGKGSARRKKKIIRKVTTTDDKKIQSSLKKLSVTNISGIEEVNMIKSDGKVINFNNPTVQASLSANTFAISGHGEEKHFTDLLPQILNHLGADGFNQIKRHASSMAQGMSTSAADADDEVPELVEDFEAASKAEAPVEAAAAPAEVVEEEKKVEMGEEADDEDDEDEDEEKADKPKVKKTSKKSSKKSSERSDGEDSENEDD